MKRVIDVFLSSFLLLIFFLPMVLLGLLVKITSKGPVLFWSDRVGLNSKIFSMPKFRTMLTDTPNVATDLLKDSERFITPVGKLLRRTSLDELPQLWSILSGEMSFVGPRPALFNQYKLIKMRNDVGVDSIRPGLTGWAQVNGRDEIPDREKVGLDEFYLQNQSLTLDLKILVSTLLIVINGRGVVH